MPKNGAFDSAVQTYGRGVIRWRWLILLVVVLLVAAAASGGRFLWFDTDYRVFFSEDNPQLKAFDELQNVYGKNDNVLFVLAPAGGEVFTAPGAYRRRAPDGEGVANPLSPFASIRSPTSSTPAPRATTCSWPTWCPTP